MDWKRWLSSHWFAIVLTLLGGAIILFLLWPFFRSAPGIFAQALHASVTWSTVVGAILETVASLIAPVAILLLIALIADTLYYYWVYKSPYLLFLLGRDPPVKITKTAAYDFKRSLILLSFVQKATASCGELMRASTSSWASLEDYLAAFGRWQGTQFEFISSAFKRREGDKISAYLMIVQYEPGNFGKGTLSFWGDNERTPLAIENSVAGRAVRSTLGDAVTIANIANVFYDPDFAATNRSRDYKALLCIPIVCQDVEDSSPHPYFVLSVDSTIEEAFGVELQDAAKSIAACIGILGQRMLELAAMFEEKSGPEAA